MDVRQDFIHDLNDKIEFLWHGITSGTYYDTEMHIAYIDSIITLLALKAQILDLINTGEENESAS